MKKSDRVVAWKWANRLHSEFISATDGLDAIQQCVGILLREIGATRDIVQDVANVIQRREQLGCTNIGRGIACPHSKHPVVDALLCCNFIMDPVVQWEGPFWEPITDEPIRLVFCMISTSNSPGDHLRALEEHGRFSRIVCNDCSLYEMSAEDVRSKLLHAIESGNDLNR
jgi:mannitol/fructose-specific phosphotransferase system IIA component (Ntr-type)